MDNTLQEQLEQQLYEKVKVEHDAYLAEIKTKPADEIISNAYEIAWRENLLYLFDSSTGLTEKRLQVLLEMQSPCAEMYASWLKKDSEELDAIRGCMENCADNILRDRAEKKYSDPAQPMYGKSRQEAYACDELTEWGADHRRSVECARVFQKEGGTAYHEQTFPTFLQKWETDFGKDRCMFVLACTMAQRTGDERFYPPARQAAGRFAALQKQMGGHTDVYAVDNHSCVINAAMEQLAKPERSVERKAVKKDAPER